MIELVERKTFRIPVVAKTQIQLALFILVGLVVDQANDMSTVSTLRHNNSPFSFLLHTHTERCAFFVITEIIQNAKRWITKGRPKGVLLRRRNGLRACRPQLEIAKAQHLQVDEQRWFQLSKWL